MKLSIIIITKNEEKQLPKLLGCIACQDYNGEYEVIVADAHSTDKTREIAKKFGCKVVEGGLHSKARNNGAKHSNGDLLLFLDADIMFRTDFLRKSISDFRYKKLDVGGPTQHPLSDKKIDRIFYSFYNFFVKLTQLFYPHAGGYCIFCTRRMFDKVGGFNEKVLFAEDHEFVGRCQKAGGKFRILKRSPVFCDVRRLEREGRFTVAGKYLWGFAYRTFKGEFYNTPFDYVSQGVNPKKK